MSRYRGQQVSEGVAVGEIYPGDEPAAAIAADADTVRAAFATVARERAAFAAQLRARGDDLQAGIVEIGALIAADPALTGPALDAVAAGTDAAEAVTAAAEAQAAMLAALPDPDLAQRATDVRQVAGAVLVQLRGGAEKPPPTGPFILVRRDLDPAELIHLADAEGSGLAGAVSVNGGATSHAAIIARSLGLPMLAGADPAVLRLPAGHRAVLDAHTGELITDPAVTRAAITPARSHTPAPSTAQATITTVDGHQVTLLCNVASAAETRLGLAAGATGVGLLRTEIGFTNASGWPSEQDHFRQLDPILRRLTGRPAVVRLLDFSGDKVPPFLRSDSGLVALLRAPGALDAQLRAILRAGSGADVCVLIPMVTSPDEILQVRDRLTAAAAACEVAVPQLGIMVEVAATAANAAEFAKLADFFSIGTNDLTSEVLGIDRADPRSSPARAADPRVLELIAGVLAAADDAGIKVSVCGDAAADSQVLPLLLALGVRTLSVGAASVGRVADQVGRTRAAS